MFLIRLISVYLRAERVQKLSVVILNMIYACVVYDVIILFFSIPAREESPGVYKYLCSSAHLISSHQSLCVCSRHCQFSTLVEILH